MRYDIGERWRNRKEVEAKDRELRREKQTD